jgi:hypothetical protein
MHEVESAQQATLQESPELEAIINRDVRTRVSAA